MVIRLRRRSGGVKDPRRASGAVCVALALYPADARDCVLHLMMGQTVTRRMSYVEGATEKLLSFLPPLGIDFQLEHQTP